MGNIADLGEELDLDLIQVNEAVGDQVHVRERSRVSEAVSRLLLGVGDAAGDCAATMIPVVVGCLTEQAETGIDPEDEESYYSDEEDHGEVDLAVAAKGLGQVGNVSDTGHSVVAVCAGGSAEPVPKVEGHFTRSGIVGRRWGARDAGCLSVGWSTEHGSKH